MSELEKQAKKETYSNFGNFDEMLITHGFATLFAVTSPWVCTATLLSVFLEIWIDTKGLLENRQRPIPYRARTNEPWSTAFDIYGLVAALTNVLLLIFASRQYESWTLTEKLTLFVFLEHIIIGSRFLIKLILPEVPRTVEVLQLKQENVVHRALEGLKVEVNQDFSMFRSRVNMDTIEVFEFDLLDSTEAEPELSLRDSGKSMVKGIISEMDSIRSSALNAVA